MSFTVASFRKDLAKDKQNDHYGFHKKSGRGVRASRNKKSLKEVELSDEDEDEDDASSTDSDDNEDDAENSFSDSDNDASVTSEQSDGGTQDEGEEHDDWAFGGGSQSRKRRATAQGGGKRKRSKAHGDDWGLPFRARVTTLAVTDDVAEADMAKQNLAKVDTAILARIKKALALAGHVGTGEAEARNAMRMASKLMQSHNVSQADILASESDEQRAKRAGQSVVTITSTKDKKVVKEQWVDILASAMNKFFNSKVYSTRWTDRKKLTWTFYGLAEGTVAAAQAFETCHNQIHRWSAEQVKFKGRNAKNLYRVGVAEGLVALGRKEQREEEEAAQKAEAERLRQAAATEKAQREAEIARLQEPKIEAQDVKDEPSDRKVKLEEVADDDDPLRLSAARPPSPVWQPRGDDDAVDSDDDEVAPVADFLGNDDVDENMDLDATLLKAEENIKIKNEQVDVKPPPPPPTIEVKPEPEDIKPGWASAQQLVRFRNDAANVADQFLKDQKVKLAKGKKAKVIEFKDPTARQAYRQGKLDATKLDVKRKRIEDAQ